MVTSIPRAHQVLGHLQADEARPDDHGRLGRHTNVGGQAGRVLDDGDLRVGVKAAQAGSGRHAPDN
jgi:hypothetical protein